MGTDWPGGTLSSEDAWGWAAKGSSGSLNTEAQKCQAEDENRCSSLDKALIVHNLIQHILTEHPQTLSMCRYNGGADRHSPVPIEHKVQWGGLARVII